MGCGKQTLRDVGGLEQKFPPRKNQGGNSSGPRATKLCFLQVLSCDMGTILNRLPTCSELFLTKNSQSTVRVHAKVSAALSDHRESFRQKNTSQKLPQKPMEKVSAELSRDRESFRNIVAPRRESPQKKNVAQTLAGARCEQHVQCSEIACARQPVHNKI